MPDENIGTVSLAAAGGATAAGKKADIDKAVAAARRAFTEGPWPRMLPRERSRILHRIADIVESRDARLAELESFDSGLPITQALGQARRAAENFRFFADLIVAQADDTYKVPGRQINYVNRKPIGVAGPDHARGTPRSCSSRGSSARPWRPATRWYSNPPSSRPLSASLWAGIFEEAGLPKGVFNLVNGLGEDAGDALVKHPDVPLISFTGESSTGQLIFGNAAPFLKGLSMELGGKSPAVVFADADLDAAIDATIFGVFSLNGERCTAGSRILVQRDIYDEFVKRYAAQAKRVVVGYPHDPKHRGRRTRSSRALRQSHELRRDRQDRGSARCRRRAAGRLRGRQLRRPDGVRGCRA